MKNIFNSGAFVLLFLVGCNTREKRAEEHPTRDAGSKATFAATTQLAGKTGQHSTVFALTVYDEHGNIIDDGQGSTEPGPLSISLPDTHRNWKCIRTYYNTNSHSEKILAVSCSQNEFVKSTFTLNVKCALTEIDSDNSSVTLISNDDAVSNSAVIAISCITRQVAITTEIGEVI